MLEKVPSSKRLSSNCLIRIEADGAKITKMLNFLVLSLAVLNNGEKGFVS